MYVIFVTLINVFDKHKEKYVKFISLEINYLVGTSCFFFLFLFLRNIDTVVLWKLRVKPRDFQVLNARGLLYLFRYLICIQCYISLNLGGLTPLFGLSLLLTTLKGLCHFRICSTDLFNGHLGISSSSKSVTSFPLSSMFCSVSFSSSVSSCSFSGISTS